MRRGEIWWASLPAPQGSGPGYPRPVVVIQDDRFNESPIRTVVVAVVTSNLCRAAAPGNVFLEQDTSYLPSDSVVNVSQLLTVDKSIMIERVAALPNPVMANVDAGLRLVTGL